jgi:hypothetical protein
MLGTEVAMVRSWMVLSVLGVSVPLSVLASACGGAEFNAGGVDDGGGGGSNDAANPSDASGSNDGNLPGDGGGGQPDVRPPPPPQDGGMWSPICPIHQPAAGVSCSMEGLECEYGNVDPNPACSTIMQCTNGTFQPTMQYGACVKQPNGSECAASFAGVPRGMVCSPSGATCNYELGDCRCEVQGFGVIPPLIDGSVQPAWDCDDPGPGCPTPRARLGSACTQNGQSCMYRPCSFGEQCQNGYWQPELIACAGAMP